MKRTALYTAGDTEEWLSLGREWNFHGAYTQEHLHSLHPYPAKFIPQIPRKALLNWTQPGDLVYDPFCGCGTTLLEASMLGRPSIGTDNNSIAILVSKAKIATYPQSARNRLQKFQDRFERNIRGINGYAKEPPIPALHFWYDKKILHRLSAIKSLIARTSEPDRTLLLSVFSSILVKASYQDSDTRYTRVARDLEPDDVSSMFMRKLRDVLPDLPALSDGARATAAASLADARHVPFIENQSISFIVTSPPYLNAYDYHKYHRQRLLWTDGDVEHARDLEIGGHDEFTKANATPDQYFVDMKECFSEWYRVLKRRGRCLVLIGDAIVTKKAVPVADNFVELATECGLRLESRWIRELQPTKRSFNIRNSRMTHEHVLLFRKP